MLEKNEIADFNDDEDKEEMLKFFSDALGCDITIYDDIEEKFYIKAAVKGIYSFNINILVEKATCYVLYNEEILNVKKAAELFPIIKSSLELKITEGDMSKRYLIKQRVPKYLYIKYNELKEQMSSLNKKITKEDNKANEHDRKFKNESKRIDKEHKELIRKLEKRIKELIDIISSKGILSL